MSCLCHKLLERQYSNITEHEAEVLTRTWTEVPHLFKTTSPTPPDSEPARHTWAKRPTSGTSSPARKRPRSLRGSFSNSLILHQPQHQPLEAVPNPALSFATATTTRLETTYSYQNAATILRGDSLQIQQPGGVYVKIYRAIERSDQFQRICYYAFAKRHQKGTSIDPIVKEIQEALHQPAQDTKQRVYHILHVGNKWAAIIEQFASIVGGVPQQLTGLLSLLGSPSNWERATTDDCRLALRNLYYTTDIYKKTLEVTPLVSRFLNEILLESSFIDETHKLTSQSNFITMPVSKPGPSCLASSAASTGRVLHAVSEAEPVWKAPSLVGATGSSDIHSDANILLVLLSFFNTSEKLPLDLLFRGATPRKRWNAYGDIDEVDARRAGLAPALVSLLSDIQKLSNAFYELDRMSAVSKNSDQTYTLNDAVVSRARERVPPEQLSFWKYQALIVAYRAIPWKYIEPVMSNPKLFLSHLQQTLHAFQDGFEDLPVSARPDLALTLVEASRFPGMAWKRFVVGQAEAAARGLDDRYLRYCIAQSQCLLSRIAGNMDRAASSLGELDQGALSSTATDKRMHSTIGQATIQRSLNCIQVDDVSDAKKHLEGWSPLDQSPSPMETVVLFRKDMILGRVLRFRAEFNESLAHLKRSLDTAERHKDLIFDDDLRDLTCDLADTLRELDDPVTAEQHLRAEIMRRDQSCGPSSGGCRLELSLAEALFAQRRIKEAQQLCLDLQTRPGVFKFEKLRLHVMLAKIRHVDSDDEGASRHWADAMVAVSKFPNENCATRIIVLSVCDILSRRRCPDDPLLLDKSWQHLRLLDEREKPGGFRCWIAGMRHWADYLSKDVSVRSRL